MVLRRAIFHSYYFQSRSRIRTVNLEIRISDICAFRNTSAFLLQGEGVLEEVPNARRMDLQGVLKVGAVLTSRKFCSPALVSPKFQALVTCWKISETGIFIKKSVQSAGVHDRTQPRVLNSILLNQTIVKINGRETSVAKIYRGVEMSASWEL